MFGNLFNMKNILITAYILSCFKEVAPLFLSRTQVILSDFRENSYALYKKNIDPTHSFHKQAYEAMETRLQKEGAAVAFTLPAKAVVDKVVHALEAKQPKMRYYVTFPTYLFAVLKRILPMSWLDALLRKV
jgi:hypothetical protein